MKVMNGTYYEIVGGMEDDVIVNINETSMDDDEAKRKALNTERCAYKNTYVNGKRVESIKLWDPYNDECFLVGTDDIHYEKTSPEMEFRYQMLSRLKMDCDYFLGNGNGYEGHLWAGDVESHIKEMRKRLREFKATDKPEWLTTQDIDKYEVEMLEKRRTA